MGHYPAGQCGTVCPDIAMLQDYIPRPGVTLSSLRSQSPVRRRAASHRTVSEHYCQEQDLQEEDPSIVTSDDGTRISTDGG